VPVLKGIEVNKMSARSPQDTPNGSVPCILSVDVEDWFHILDLPTSPRPAQWASLPSRVERNLSRLLDLFSAGGIRTTCFFLGWVAERYPHLVKEAAARGHEIASHGYAHQLAYKTTRKDFLDDVRKAKDILERIAGAPVCGYRSPGFSCTEEVPWFFDVLAESGHRYDSSVFPAPRGHGGMKTSRLAPHVIETRNGPLLEFPITVVRWLGRPLCMFGGGYLRIAPYALVRTMAQRVVSEGRPVVFYVHPREIDPDHPRLPMSLQRRFKCYVNLRTTEAKVRQILEDFPLVTFQQFIAQHPF
jgi:polysaccharide deacetylase family protein (PEP-CTERM system associated)